MLICRIILHNIEFNLSSVSPFIREKEVIMASQILDANYINRSFNPSLYNYLRSFI